MSEKACQCPEGPKVTQAIPIGYKGDVICGKCEGNANWPRPEKNYEGKDPVEGFLFDIKKNSSGLTFETAVLTMLLRIERVLLQRGGGNGNIHR
jgi:hypothetical protein